MKPMPPTHKRRPMATRYETQRQWIARLLLLGWTTEQIATRLHCSSRMVRWKISTPEFQKLFAELQHELYQHIDRRIHKLLDKAVTALFRMLRHRDWRARDAAVEKILRMHAKYVERIDVTGTLEHTGPVRHDVNHDLLRLPPMDDMTDEQRQLARQLLQATRATQPQRPPRVLGVSYDPPGQS